LQDLQPVHLGHQDVEQDEIDALGAHDAERAPSVRRVEHREVLVEGEAQRLANSGVVVDDEHHRALVDGRVGRRRLSLALVGAVPPVRIQDIARFLRNDGHLRVVTV
jgi:hypothetical protein